MPAPPAANDSNRTGLADLSPVRRRIRLLIWLLILATVGAWAFLETPREVARWYLAGALVERQSGRNDLAAARLDKALRWTPEVAAILSLRSEVLMSLGRHEEAIADWMALDRLSQTRGTPSRAEALNGLAYFRAVANLDLDKALSGVNEALAMSPHDPMYLDTRGFILHQQGNSVAALADLNPAVAAIERQRQSRADRLALKESTLSDPSDPGPSLESLTQSVAVVRYHRALVLEKLGRHAESKADRARAKQLIGREPDESLF